MLPMLMMTGLFLATLRAACHITSLAMALPPGESILITIASTFSSRAAIRIALRKSSLPIWPPPPSRLSWASPSTITPSAYTSATAGFFDSAGLRVSAPSSANGEEKSSCSRSATP